jgi:hypothetical protein
VACPRAGGDLAMSRLMSVALTTDAVRKRTKTVTRRLGWTFVKEGDTLTLCAKVQGRRPGEPLDRIAEVQVTSVRREPLRAITAEDVRREGFTGHTPRFFIAMFCEAMRCTPETLVTRIEWRYL